MYLGEVITVNEAAHRLGVAPQHVRALLANGSLDGERVGPMWLIPTNAVERRRQEHTPVGRPFGQRLSWAILAALEDRVLPYGLSREEQRRVRRQLDQPLTALSPRLRGRSRRERLSITPRAFDRLASDRRWVVGGERGGVHLGLARDASAPLQLYLRGGHLEELVEETFAVPDALDGNLIAHVVEDRYWSFGEDQMDHVWPSVVCLDLLESSYSAGDPRAIWPGPFATPSVPFA